MGTVKADAADDLYREAAAVAHARRLVRLLAVVARDRARTDGLVAVMAIDEAARELWRLAHRLGLGTRRRASRSRRR